MTNQNIANWLKSQIDVGDGISVGAIDESKSRFIGVYDSKSAGKQRVCIGGKSATKYQTKNVVSLFIGQTTLLLRSKNHRKSQN